MYREQDRAGIEVDCAALRENLRFLRGKLHKTTKFCAVLKANAYGHGAPRLARLAAEEGVDFLAAATLGEALALRREVSAPILILGYTPPECASVLARAGITQTVFSPAYANELAAHARAEGVRVEAHLKIDTGMHRLGFTHEDIAGMCQAVSHPSLNFTGVFSHFAAADESADRTAAQYRRFADALVALGARGVSFPLRHIANSAALLAAPATQADMVRVGLALYGISPLPTPVSALRPVLKLVARIVQVRRIGAGEAVGYGGTFVAKKPAYIATLPVGYADGLLREAASLGRCAAWGDKVFPLVGRVSMDQCTVLLGEEPIAEGEFLTLLGGAGVTSVQQTAKTEGRIPYELLTSLGARLPRVYRNE